MRTIRPAFALLGLLAGACIAQSGNRPIPPGTYYAEDSPELITVRDSTIHFRVHSDIQNPGRYIDREYEYSVGYGLLIGISPLVSTDPMTGQDYRWYASYGRIGRIDPQNGRITWFSRTGCGSWKDFPFECLFPDWR